MVFFALLMTAMFASLVAVTAHRRIAASPPMASPFDGPFYRGMFVIIAVHIPVMGYFYYAYTDWALAYLIDPLRLPLVFGFVLASFAFSGYFFFYLGTQTLLRAHRPLTAMLATAQAALAVAIFGLLFRNELTKLGTYFEFHSGTAQSIGVEHGLFEILFGVMLFTLSGIAVLIWNVIEDRKFPDVEFEDSKW